MKISKIRFKNIHSLRGEHHIDFSSGPLAESGLFAITGATGSGKSTLLDVITLALFNKVPRIGAISKAVIEDQGGIMTRNAADCYAEVEYIVEGKTYRSHWSIERNRNNNLKDRKQEIIDVTTGAIIESGKSSVPTKNEELIGLSYDQFVKAIVLSQGQFSKLLKAKRDERNKLLEDITGAKDYRSIGIAVYRKFKEAQDACEKQEVRLGEVELLPEEEKTKLIAQERELTKAKTTQKKALEVLKAEIDNKKGILKNELVLKANNDLQKQLAKDLDAFKKEESRLQKHAKYVVHTPLISDYEQKDKALKEHTEELSKQTAHEKMVLKDYNDLLQQATTLLKKTVEPSEFNQALNTLNTTYTALKKVEDLAQAEAKLYEDAIKKLLGDINKDTVRIPFDGQPSTFVTGVTPVEDKVLGFLKTAQVDTTHQLEARENKVNESLATLGSLKVAFTKYQSELQQKQSKETELKGSEAQVVKHSAILKDLDKELPVLDAEVTKLTKEEEHRKTHQSLEAHRNQLVDGEACPLCGALEHPFASQQPVFDVKADVLRSKKELLHTKRELKASIQALLKSDQATSKRLQKELLEAEKALQPKATAIEKLCASLEVATVKTSAAIESLEAQVLEDSKKLTQIKKALHLRDLITDLKIAAKLWEEKTRLKAEKESKRKALYEGDGLLETIQTLLNRWSANTQNRSHTTKTIATLNAKIEEVSKERSAFETVLKDILKQEGINSLQELKTNILSESQAENIRRQQNTLQLKQERLKTEQTAALKELEGFKKAITKEDSLEELQNKYTSLEEESARTNQQIGVILTRLEADKKIKAKQEELLAELKSLKKEEALWKTMNSLIGDANGKKFSNFVQDLTLEQLIGYTNLRLKDLSDRYVLDIPTAEEADKNDALKVFDMHQGDARRTINTLSGGETFMVSLAMAFALSDLAAKNVKIESVFIDEGFGTLDPETLNQAITILEKMQNEGDKSIGVISHVEALKERITTQIRLEKSGSGYSTLQIIK
ncbi:AAA family ATPase [Oceanihabitans sediminis]|uniref:AAA family ATPase n=1 Tax=Oceanihabitans sediminis TaxID=1812012 RepID=UPI003A92BFFE